MELLQQSCFSQYEEATNTIVIDENNIVIIGNKLCIDIDLPESQDADMTTDELLIACVGQKPALYDHRLSVAERTLLKTNALWQEICNIMGDIMDVATAKIKMEVLGRLLCEGQEKKTMNTSQDSKYSAQKFVDIIFTDVTDVIDIIDIIDITVITDTIRIRPQCIEESIHCTDIACECKGMFYIKLK
ncbi:hypothetical protein RF55_20497 [Lasius niger]|uniref:Uncharacterized protein n=1 Tax=Lasius niger TaxID=67767 RepID=A0A0J7JYV2_LASNI|nr:hypothetical protein RF55_20497 [Lasius niger]